MDQDFEKLREETATKGMNDVFRIVIAATRDASVAFRDKFERLPPTEKALGAPATLIRGILDGDTHLLTVETAFHIVHGAFRNTMVFTPHELHLTVTAKAAKCSATRSYEYKWSQNSNVVTILIPQQVVREKVEEAIAELRGTDEASPGGSGGSATPD